MTSETKMLTNTKRLTLHSCLDIQTKSSVIKSQNNTKQPINLLSKVIIIKQLLNLILSSLGSFLVFLLKIPLQLTLETTLLILRICLLIYFGLFTLIQKSYFALQCVLIKLNLTYFAKSYNPLAPITEKYQIRKKLNLVLDLDETLIHCNTIPLNDQAIQLPVKGDSLYLHIRPFAIEFLRTLGDYYHISIYTASQKNYADQIIDIIDDHYNITERYYRQNCQIDQLGYIKKLSIIDKDESKSILIDNSKISCQFNENNSILIPSWYGKNMRDEQLKILMKVLIELANYPQNDIRPFIKDFKHHYQ